MSGLGILVGLLLSTGDASGDVPRSPAVPTAGTLPTELRDAVLIEAIVARVNRHPITQSQLDLEARLTLAQHGHVAEAQASLSPGELRTALDLLIDQMLIEEEAARLQVFPITDEQTRAESQKLVGQFPSAIAYQEFVERFAISGDAVEDALRRDLRAEHYLTDRIRTQLRVGASPGEAEAVGKDLVAQLRSRADIRILMQLEPGTPTQSSATRPPPGHAEMP